MRYIGIKVFAEKDTVEAVADAMWSVGAEGVSVSDGTELSDASPWDYIEGGALKEKPIYAEFFVLESEVENKKDALLTYLRNIYNIVVDESKLVVSQPFDKDEWYNSWKKYYKEQHAGRYSIVPEWLTPSNINNPFNILINPGMAFGTGEHASTRLALSLMSNIDFANKTVIDVGTGSGILGIAGAKSGASSVYMCDIDSDAIKASKNNIELNAVQSLVTTEVRDLIGENSHNSCDIMLANLTADLLKRLAPKSIDCIKNEGVLITSGIIKERLNETIDVFTNLNYEVLEIKEEGEWRAVAFKRH